MGVWVWKAWGMGHGEEEWARGRLGEWARQEEEWAFGRMGVEGMGHGAWGMVKKSGRGSDLASGRERGDL